MTPGAAPQVFRGAVSRLDSPRAPGLGFWSQPMAKPPTPATELRAIVPQVFGAHGDTATTDEVACAVQGASLEQKLARVREAYPEPLARFVAGLAVLRSHAVHW